MGKMYDKYKYTDLWISVERAIGDLVINNDIEEFTTRENIIGYICKNIEDNVGIKSNKN